MKKQRMSKFKKKIIIFIVFIFIALLFILIRKRFNDLKEQASKCDLAKGYTCTSYEIRNFKTNE